MPTPEDELSAFMNQNIGKEDAAEKMRAKVRKEWAHDEDECNKRLRLIDDWVRDHL